ncbi:hypothetical protein MMC28_003355 [Mycoblastus sanguinarius]|nr:hypothetical protein [Mycoblastus sanguinarius]
MYGLFRTLIHENLPHGELIKSSPGVSSSRAPSQEPGHQSQNLQSQGVSNRGVLSPGMSTNRQVQNQGTSAPRENLSFTPVQSQGPQDPFNDGTSSAIPGEDEDEDEDKDKDEDEDGDDLSVLGSYLLSHTGRVLRPRTVNLPQPSNVDLGSDPLSQTSSPEHASEFEPDPELTPSQVREEANQAAQDSEIILRDKSEKMVDNAALTFLCYVANAMKSTAMNLDSETKKQQKLSLQAR